MHTESEARGLWCPMSRDFNGVTSGKCLASACAMWRWSFYPTRGFRMAETPDREAMTEPARPAGIPPTWTFCPYNPDDGEPAGWVEPVDECNARRQGYCGLAPLPA